MKKQICQRTKTTQQRPRVKNKKKELSSRSSSFLENLTRSCEFVLSNQCKFGVHYVLIVLSLTRTPSAWLGLYFLHQCSFFTFHLIALMTLKISVHNRNTTWTPPLINQCRNVIDGNIVRRIRNPYHIFKFRTNAHVRKRTFKHKFN